MSLLLRTLGLRGKAEGFGEEAPQGESPGSESVSGDGEPLERGVRQAQTVHMHVGVKHYPSGCCGLGPTIRTSN
jgi:hypothetical protein